MAAHRFKFPKEDFEWLVQAYEHGDAAQIEESRKAFCTRHKKNAPPTSAAVISTRPTPPTLPSSSCRLKVYMPKCCARQGLFESIRTECKINIAGPTTLSAFLSSLQMGFRTLAIEKRSGEVWQLLSAVKTEFSNFSGLLQKAKTIYKQD
jgi:DNA recombination protein RmuC